MSDIKGGQFNGGGSTPEFPCEGCGGYTAHESNCPHHTHVGQYGMHYNDLVNYVADNDALPPRVDLGRIPRIGTEHPVSNPPIEHVEDRTNVVQGEFSPGMKGTKPLPPYSPYKPGTLGKPNRKPPWPGYRPGRTDGPGKPWPFD